MERIILVMLWIYLLQVLKSDAIMDATTFKNIVYKRGVPHRKRVSPRECVAFCEGRRDCWGINYIGGRSNLRGECQLLYKSIATCDPANHRRAPTNMNTVALWVSPSCPINSNEKGPSKSYKSKGKSFQPNEPCSGTNASWRVFDNRHVISGAYIKGPETFLDCLDSCVKHSGCAAVDFNFDFNTCFHFGVGDMEKEGYTMEDDYCCAHAKITCKGDGLSPQTTTSPKPTSPPPVITTSKKPGIGGEGGGRGGGITVGRSTVSGVVTGGSTSRVPRPTYSAPVTLPTQPPTQASGLTEKPKYFTTTQIPDTGCPGPFMKFENSGRQDGLPVFDLPVNTSEACKELCLEMKDNCTAVDFDKVAMLCFVFTDPEPDTLQRGTRPCCDHYVKLDCDDLDKMQCYKHSAYLFLANPNEHNIIVSAMPPLVPPDLEVVDCEGVCYQNLDHDPQFGFFSLERGCNTSIGAGRTWRACLTDRDPFVFDKRCTCHFDRCNAVNTFLFDHLTCHYPFDKHAMDLSGFNRHGVETDVTYDPATSKRSYSAHFNGVSSFIHFPAWRLVHSEHISPSGRPILSFTMAMWVLRPQSAQGSMTILSTYSRDLSTVQIVSDLDISNPWNPMQTIRASVIVNYTMFDVSAQAPLDEWFFIAFRLDGLKNPPLLMLDIDNLEDLKPDAQTELTNVTALDELTITNRGLYLGKQAQIIEEIDEPYFFEGNIDDYFCYDKALSYHELLALRDMHLPIP